MKKLSELTAEEAIDHQCVTHWVNINEHAENKWHDAINKLMYVANRQAIDRKISEDAEALYQQGYSDAMEHAKRSLGNVMESMMTNYKAKGTRL